jgi:hypothetical protein
MRRDLLRLVMLPFVFLLSFDISTDSSGMADRAGPPGHSETHNARAGFNTNVLVWDCCNRRRGGEATAACLYCQVNYVIFIDLRSGRLGAGFRACAANPPPGLVHFGYGGWRRYRELQVAACLPRHPTPCTVGVTRSSMLDHYSGGLPELSPPRLKLVADETTARSRPSI